MTNKQELIVRNYNYRIEVKMNEKYGSNKGRKKK